MYILIYKLYTTLRHYETHKNAQCKGLNRHFSKENILLTNKHMKRCSVSLVIGEMEMKATRYHFRSNGVAIKKKMENNKGWERCGEIGTLVYCYWEYKLVQPLGRTVWQFFKMLNVELPHDPAIPVLGKYSTYTQKN